MNPPTEAVAVPKDLFYHLIYRFDLNVHATRISMWDQEHGFLYEWKNPSRVLFGWSDCGDGAGLVERRYWLAPATITQYKVDIDSYLDSLVGGPA